MCGIAGVLRFDGRPVERVELSRMCRALAHRGPDDEGFLLLNRASARCEAFHGNESIASMKSRTRNIAADGEHFVADLGLAHRRFSIIDLSPAGHQPFVDQGRTCCVVFNGEIYNYLELRDELTRLGRVFSSNSDTEVLLEAYKQWGCACFERFIGFWAVALYDFRTQALVLSRDRLGKKPLFWSRVGEVFYFSSEIKALLEVDVIRRSVRVNETVAARWLLHKCKDIDDETFFTGILAFPRASYAQIDRSFSGAATHFWRIPMERMQERDMGISEACRRLRDLLDSAVALRLRADVPVGVELSGGMDSSTIAAIAAEQSRDRLRLYTVAFEDPEWNELAYANAMAKRLGMEHIILTSPIDSFWKRIYDFIYLEEEPHHAPNLQTNQESWQQMREHGAKVSLNGAGGDECFAGYGNYYSPLMLEMLASGRLKDYWKNAIGHSESGNIAKTLARPIYVPILESWRKSRRGSLARHKYLMNLNAVKHPASGICGSKVLCSDMTSTLMPYWLTSGDRGYMGVPLEVRAPLIDHRIVEFAFRLPISYLLHDGWHKWILRKAMNGILPDEVVWRRKKMGFPFPFKRFFRESRPVLDLVFASARNPYVDMAQRRLFDTDWKVLSFILWYELFFNGNVDLFRGIESLASRGKSEERTTRFVPAFHRTVQS
jgi:asparagine synthase (glutamine-hydrolysing)